MNTAPLPSISVLIVSYNSAECLRATLEAALGQDYPDYEVIVLDNASRDRSLEIARAFEPRGLRVIANAGNRGFAGGNNDAVRASRGEIVFLVNPDAVMTGPECLREVAAAFGERPDLGILGAKLMNADNDTILHCGGTVGLPAHCTIHGSGEADRGQRDEPAEVEFVIGAALALRRALWDRLGGFDEDFNPAYYEDTDLCLRCRRLGKKVLYWPRLRLIHPEGVKSCAAHSPAFWWHHHFHRLWYSLKNATAGEILWRVLPAEAAWYFSGQSVGLKRFMLRVYYYALRRTLARKLLRGKGRGK